MAANNQQFSMGNPLRKGIDISIKSSSLLTFAWHSHFYYTCHILLNGRVEETDLSDFLLSDEKKIYAFKNIIEMIK